MQPCALCRHTHGAFSSTCLPWKPSVALPRKSSQPQELQGHGLTYQSLTKFTGFCGVQTNHCPNWTPRSVGRGKPRTEGHWQVAGNRGVARHGATAFDHASRSEEVLLNAHVCQGYINPQHNPPAQHWELHIRLIPNIPSNWNQGSAFPHDYKILKIPLTPWYDKN